MPDCGSQVTLCDVPVRFDTYAGCGHGCAYCFVSRKVDIKKIKPGESPAALRRWVEGKRSDTTNWCDWEIPLHWGGMSDPFQPVEKIERRSLAALEIFAETGYPFIVSTKNTMISEEPYLSLIKRCNCVVQFSACTPRFDEIERGASTFAQRIEAARKIAEFKRVNIRVQPYLPAIFRDVLKAIETYAEIGVHGIIIEAMKYQSPKVPGLVSQGKDFVYPIDVLLPQFEAIKRAAHRAGLKFYCGENRLRALSDELCCCGVEGMGWELHEANLNHHLFDPAGMRFTEKQKEPGTARVFCAAHQDTVSGKKYASISFADGMNEAALNPYPFMSCRGGGYSEQEAERLRGILCEALEKSGKKRRDIDRLLGTNGMAGHYFGKSQWSFPTPEAYEKMRLILPLPPEEKILVTKRYVKIFGKLNESRNK